MVRMSQKLLFGTQAVDWQERINTARLREERALRARIIMKKHGIASLLATRAENCRYLTGLKGPEFVPQLWYVLFFAEGDPVVFAHAGYVNQFPDQAPWIKNWRIARSWFGGGCGVEATRAETRLFANEIYEELKKRGLSGEKLGIIGFDGLAREALSSLGISVVDASQIMFEATAIKTADEILCLKTVAAICEAAWYKIWDAIKPGIRDKELAKIAIAALYDAGAEEVPAIGFYSGPLTFERGFRGSDRLIETGDLLYLPMCGITYMGYKSCNYRTFIAGRKPSEKEKDWYKKLVERLDRVIDAIKPGNTTADAAKYFPAASTWGYHDEAEVLTIEIGHGIGLSNYGPPIVNRQWSLTHPQVFEKGMTLAVEGREGEFRVGGVRLENMVVVTENGAEVIDHMPREEILGPKT